MNHSGGVEAGPPPVDPVLGFIRRELAASPERWIGSLSFAGLALLGVIATVTFRIPSPVLVFAGILMLSVPHPRRPFGQAFAVTAASCVGAVTAILLAMTSYDQPWLYLPLQCGALTGLLVLSRITDIRAGFILAAMLLSFAEPAYLASPEMAIRAALFNALAVAGTAWVVAAAQSIHPIAKAETQPAPQPHPDKLAGFSVLALTAIGLQMLLYNTIGLPEIRTGVIAVLLTADTDLRGVFDKMPLRQLCAAGCALLALLLIAVGAPVMDDLGFFALLAAGAYFAVGWVAHGGPRIAFACVPGAVAVTLVLLLDFHFVIDIVPSLLGVAGVLWGVFVTAVIALLLSRLGERHAGLERPQLPDVPPA